jgi:hypothetical protein
MLIALCHVIQLIVNRHHLPWKLPVVAVTFDWIQPATHWRAQSHEVHPMPVYLWLGKQAL